MPSQLIIAAISARGYAQAAQVFGYHIVTLDAFVDADTRKLAAQSLQINMIGDCVDEADFKQKFEQISFRNDCQFAYGSIFDSNPALLAWVVERVNVVGNLPSVLALSRSFQFFDVLDGLAINYPEVSLDAPKDGGAWLVKRFNATGGAHVKLAEDGVIGDYFQRKMDGVPVSLLFLANGEDIKVVGFNQQLIDATANAPYRFAGAVSDAVLPQQCQQALIDVATGLTQTLGLRGLNSVDAVFDGEKIWVLELNPRLSATFQLYSNLWQAHMQACAGKFIDLVENKASKAEYVLYADRQLKIAADFDWPVWVADMPFVGSDGMLIDAGLPICSVLAEGESASVTHELVLERVKKLKGKLFHD